MIPNPWVLLGIVLAWGASLAGVGYWQNSTGHISERVVWQQRALTEQAAADTKYKALETRYRLTEQDSARTLAATSAAYQKDLQNAKIKNDAVVAGIRAGAVRLRDPGTRPVCTGGSAPDSATPGAVGHNGPTTGELSHELAEFLTSEAGRADDIVRQLTACQAVILDDRRAVNAE